MLETKITGRLRHLPNAAGGVAFGAGPTDLGVTDQPIGALIAIAKMSGENIRT